MNPVIILILTAIGLICGAIIYIAYIKIPHKVKGLEKIEEISNTLPGINCGACGFAGCFAYAQAISKDTGLITESPCAVTLQNPEAVSNLEKALKIKLDSSAFNNKAIIHCGGDSETIYNYSGVESCKAAVQLSGGYKKCPYACLGFGDCMSVCPYDAISMDKERNIATIDIDKCTGCGLCVGECPHNLIELVPAATKISYRCNYQPLRDIPGREKCQYGCIHCRKCFNACEYDAITWNKERAIPVFDIEKCALSGKCVEICPTNTLAFFNKAATKIKTPTAK